MLSNTATSRPGIQIDQAAGSVPASWRASSPDFSSKVAQGWKSGSLDYAQALRDAKRHIRQQERWQSPYFWASLELVGPP